MPVSFYLDLIPVFLAVFVLLRIQILSVKDTVVKLARLSAALLIICQTTWIQSYLRGFDLVASAMDSLWTVFNTVVMILILFVIRQKEGKSNVSNY